MIAHAPRTPRVIPFYHTGMQNVVSEDPATKDVLPVGGDNVDISLLVEMGTVALRVLFFFLSFCELEGGSHGRS